MVDEFIITFVTTHMIVYLSFLEHGQPTALYLTLIPTLKVFGTTSFQVYFGNFQKVGFGHDQMCRVWFRCNVCYGMEKEESNNQIE
jgi:hypothetical protein